MAHTVMAFAVEEPEQFTTQPGMDSTDRCISACYRRIQSLEQAIRDKQKSKCISEEAAPQTWRDIADRAFTLGWNTKNLTRLQRAQILDILFRLADLKWRLNN